MALGWYRFMVATIVIIVIIIIISQCHDDRNAFCHFKTRIWQHLYQNWTCAKFPATAVALGWYRIMVVTIVIAAIIIIISQCHDDSNNDYCHFKTRNYHNMTPLVATLDLCKVPSNRSGLRLMTMYGGFYRNCSDHYYHQPVSWWQWWLLSFQDYDMTPLVSTGNAGLVQSSQQP